jgi:RES domain-containing protein
MELYRITTDQWSKQLSASGNAARWNSKGNFMIYTAQSKALACLENLVLTSGEGNNSLYSVMLIEVPDAIQIHSFDIASLKKDWYAIQHYAYCQFLGDKWLQQKKQL